MKQTVMTNTIFRKKFMLKRRRSFNGTGNSKYQKSTEKTFWYRYSIDTEKGLVPVGSIDTVTKMPSFIR